MTDLILDMLIEYPELIQTNSAHLQGNLDIFGVVNIEIKTADQTFQIHRTIAETMAFLDACDAVSGLIVNSKFGQFTVL